MAASLPPAARSCSRAVRRRLPLADCLAIYTRCFYAYPHGRVADVTWRQLMLRPSAVLDKRSSSALKLDVSVRAAASKTLMVSDSCENVRARTRMSLQRAAASALQNQIHHPRPHLNPKPGPEPLPMSKPNTANARRPFRSEITLPAPPIRSPTWSACRGAT